MAITLRSDKSSALTHIELDGNFTDLDGRLQTAEGEIDTLQTDVAALPDVTDGTANLDVSSLIINASSNEGRAMVVEATGNIGTVAKFRRNYNAASPVSALVAHGEYSIAGAAEMGSGIWVTTGATDTNNAINLSGMQGQLEEFTSETDYKAKFQIYTIDTSNPTGNGALQPVLSASQTKVEVKNTQDFVLAQSVGLHLTPTAYADLPSNTGSSDDGKIAYLTTDGAGTNRFVPIYSIGGVWKYFSDNTTVAAS